MDSTEDKRAAEPPDLQDVGDHGCSGCCSRCSPPACLADCPHGLYLRRSYRQRMELEDELELGDGERS